MWLGMAAGGLELACAGRSYNRGESNQSMYLPGLHSLRCIAACAVVVHHLEQFKHATQQPSLWSLSVVHSMGIQGVTFFFVLSGFLITYLLLREQESSGTLNVRAFYVRRALRIWPLYYLVFVGK